MVHVCKLSGPQRDLQLPPETVTGAKGEFPSVIRTTNMCIKFDQHEI